ncbi:hypothetical protein [Roseovarius confluentis]|uniref:hypothetical protein n=1 Tax=Roseovarius confluentis TaxID=1852027 RepID=UPI003BAADDAC
MPGPTAAHPIDYAALDDAGLVARAALRDARAVREITTRYNQRLFRTAWSVLRDQADAEEVVQEAYLKPFAGLMDLPASRACRHGWCGLFSTRPWTGAAGRSAGRTDLLEQDVAVLDAYRRRHGPGRCDPGGCADAQTACRQPEERHCSAHG